MALQPGTTLGPYEIQSPLGAGGMGEVYKARDTRLDRTVAIKVLLAHVADDPDLLRTEFVAHSRTCLFGFPNREGLDPSIGKPRLSA